ncbi:hypothetical protein C1H46_034181 [Malus baccata]|uniref:Reverse transcriptase zinc-binding domain-containing protein n=1 Tax=Malus baccata TaxID=106549 RepID=A0A540L1B6_MALBA|nr:hypothetical protein C1H46_034181 [Malus baccata]
MNKVPELIDPSSQESMKVKELIDPVMLSWRFDVLSALFSEEEVSMIWSMPISFRLPADRLIWHFYNWGLYTVKSGYNVAWKLVQSPSLSASTSNSDGNSYTKLWRSVWKAKIPPKVKVFVWKASQSILPTKVNLAKKGVSLEVGLRCVTEFLKRRVMCLGSVALHGRFGLHLLLGCVW